MVLEAVKLYPGSVDRRAKAEEWNEVGDLLLTVKWTLQVATMGVGFVYQ